MKEAIIHNLKRAIQIAQQAPHYRGLSKYSDVKDLFVENFFSYPIDLLQDPLSFVPSPSLKKIIVAATSSGNRPKFIYFTESDLQNHSKAVAKLFHFLKPEDKIITIAPSGSHISGRSSSIWERMGLLSMTVSMFKLDAVLHLFENLGFKVLFTGYPIVLKLLDICKQRRVSPKLLGLEKVITGGAPLPKKIRKIMQDTFGARVYNVYGMAETFALIGIEDNDGEGYRVLPSEYIFLEVISEDGSPAQKGELVVTCLQREGTQLIRYRTGDLVSWAKGNVDAPRIRVHGRLDDMIIIGHMNLYWDIDLENAIWGLPIKDYRVEILKDRQNYDLLHFYTIEEKDYDIKEEEIERAIKATNNELYTQIDEGLIKLKVTRVREFPEEFKGIKNKKIIDKRA